MLRLISVIRTCQNLRTSSLSQVFFFPFFLTPPPLSSQSTPFFPSTLFTLTSCSSPQAPMRSTVYLLTYLCPSLPVEHRPSTTPRHRTLFWAALVIPDQLVPCCFSSASVSRLQLLRGRPLFLFPCGFQVRAWRCGAGCWLPEGGRVIPET